MAAPSSTNDPPGEKTFILPESANHNTNDSSAIATAVVALPTTTTLKAPPLPTYASSEQSEYYQTAKNLLHAGDFENALLCLEEGFEFTKRVLQESAVAAADLHESMAPFHYLYGTTLLYSVEESADPQQAMMNNTTTTTRDNHNNDAEAGNDEEENGPIDPVTMATTNDNPDDDAQQDQQQQQHDDMEIAWENLESARLILTRMLSEGTTQQHHHTDQWWAKLRDDLAQCQLRAGDLQRWNAQYEMAILDYEAALDHLAPFQIRKRAEIHYNLASVCLNQVAAATAAAAPPPQKSEEPEEDETAKEKIPLTPEQLDKIRFKGFEYFYKCAVDLACVIAESAGISNWSPPIVATATTTSTIREDLKALRAIVQSWPVPTTDTSAIDSVQLLNEIQETVDEAETAETALQEATQLKEQITAAVAAQQQQQEDTAPTTNPFGQRSDADCCATPTNAFGAVPAQTTATVAQPPITMMIIKKKKKLPETDTTTVALPSSKRPKNE